MSSELANRLSLHIRKRELMRAGDRVAVAVSGGADSVALLRLLLDLRSELGVVLSVAHFNHRIRGTASNEDEQFVRDLAREHGLQFWYADADVPAYAREHKLSLEAAARDLRYDFFCSLGGGLATVTPPIDKVATAHTMDDQAETVLMRLIRGTGTSGLSGILPRRRHTANNGENYVEIVRPLLDIRRPELESYLRSHDQPWRDDASNNDLHHTRNRIRQLVLPLLEREFNPAIRERLAELAEIACGEEEYWAEHLDTGFPDRCVWRLVFDETDPWTFYPPTSEPPGQPQSSSPPDSVPSELPNVAVDCSRLLERTIGEQRRIIRRATQPSMLHLNFSDIERVLRLARAETRGDVELANGFHAWRSGGEINLGVKRDRSAVIVDGEYALMIPVLGTTEVRMLHSLLTIASKAGTGLAGGADLTKLPAPTLILRPWRPGDRFWPQHSSGPKKVKELLTDKHITGPERKLWPVIACGDNIVWLRGFGVSQPFTADDTATDAIVITEQSIES